MTLKDYEARQMASTLLNGEDLLHVNSKSLNSDMSEHVFVRPGRCDPSRLIVTRNEYLLMNHADDDHGARILGDLNNVADHATMVDKEADRTSPSIKSVFSGIIRYASALFPGRNIYSFEVSVTASKTFLKIFDHDGDAVDISEDASDIDRDEALVNLIKDCGDRLRASARKHLPVSITLKPRSDDPSRHPYVEIYFGGALSVDVYDNWGFEWDRLQKKIDVLDRIGPDARSKSYMITCNGETTHLNATSRRMAFAKFLAPDLSPKELEVYEKGQFKSLRKDIYQKLLAARLFEVGAPVDALHEEDELTGQDFLSKLKRFASLAQGLENSTLHSFSMNFDELISYQSEIHEDRNLYLQEICDNHPSLTEEVLLLQDDYLALNRALIAVVRKSAADVSALLQDISDSVGPLVLRLDDLKEKMARLDASRDEPAP